MRQLIAGLVDESIGFGLADGNTVDDIDDLTEGGITLVNTDDNQLVTNDGANDQLIANDLSDEARVYFVAKVNGKLIKSNHINPKTLKWSKTDYVAAVAKVSTIGGVGVATIFDHADIDEYIGGYFSITIVDLSKPTYDGTRYHNYESLIKQGDTVAGLINGLVTKINNDPKAIVTASGAVTTEGNEEIVFTADTETTNFQVIPGDLLEDMPIDSSDAVGSPVDFVGGTGLGAQLAEIETDYSTHRGYNPLAREKDNLYSAENLINPSTNYDVFVINWTAYDDNVLGTMDRKPEQKLLIAVESTFTTLIGELEDTLDAVKAGVQDTTFA